MQTLLHPAGSARLTCLFEPGGSEAAKKTENLIVFGGNRQSQTRTDLPPPSSIQTVTVGSGVTPDPAFVIAMHASRSGRSWALPPIGNFTLPRRLIFNCQKLYQTNGSTLPD
jgi:hypothetical protein